MIQNFSCKKTEAIYHEQYTNLIPAALHKIALRKLRMLAAASTLSDLKIPPANKLHPLTGNLKGYWAIRINQKYRLIFCFNETNQTATNVFIKDYH